MKTRYYAIGMAMKVIREKANKTLEESAMECGHSKAWLSNIEQGIRRLTFEDAKTLVDFYGYDLEYLSQLVDIFDK